MMTHRVSGSARLCMVAGLALVLAGCEAKDRTRPLNTKPIETGAGSLQAARKALEGRWTLVSFEVYPAGEAIPLTGASGSMLYDDYGNLDMQVRLSDKAIADRLVKVGVPLKDGVIATTGRAVVDPNNHTIAYILDGASPLVASNAGPLALERPRHWTYDGGVLTITTKAADGKPLSVGKWRKAS